MGPRKVPRRAGGCQGPRRLLVVALVAAGCATSDTSRESVTHTRPDGEVVTCTRPPEAMLGTDLAAGLSAGFPGIVQTLLSSDPVAKKVADIVQDAPTTDLVQVLDYRLCLEYGDGVLPKATWDQWQHDIRPAVERRARAEAGEAGPSPGSSLR
jgi:hypothetical protein